MRDMIATGTVRFSFLAALFSFSAREIVAQNGQVDGLVRDRLGNGISGVEVRVVESGARTSTDNEGRFRLRGLPDSIVTLEARKPGYLGSTAVVELRSGSIGNTMITLVPGPDRVSAFEATPPGGVVGRDTAAAKARYAEVVGRQQTGTGAFITRAQIERTSAFNTIELLAEVPGIQVQPGRVVFPRCANATDEVAVLIDGVRQRPSPRAVRLGSGAVVAEMLSRVSASQIETMEVYRALTELPDDLNANACAAIVIQTRAGPPPAPADTARRAPADTTRRTP
jgi:hypothetical protein